MSERWAGMSAKEIADDIICDEAMDFALACSDYACANEARENLRKAIEQALESYAMSCNENAPID